MKGVVQVRMLVGLQAWAGGGESSRYQHEEVNIYG
jgi:hypothetical protein